MASDALSKLLMQSAFTGVLMAVETLKNHHLDNHKIVDACDNATKMINAAFAALLTEV